eukprot:COSAG05_NODE_12781_length_455_cov_0.626404_1_plen_98_part_01
MPALPPGASLLSAQAAGIRTKPAVLLARGGPSPTMYSSDDGSQTGRSFADDDDPTSRAARARFRRAGRVVQLMALGHLRDLDGEQGRVTVPACGAARP